jgi:hypothetical protein
MKRYYAGVTAVLAVYFFAFRHVELEIDGTKMPPFAFSTMFVLATFGLVSLSWVVMALTLKKDEPLPPRMTPKELLEKLRFRPKQDI